MSAEQIYFFVGSAMLVLSALGLTVAVIMPSPNRWNKNFFVALFAIFVLCMIAFFVDLLIYIDPNMATSERITAYFEYLLPSIPMPMFTAYLLRTCGEDWRKSSLFRAVIILWIIFFILLATAQFTTLFYYVTPDNRYIRGAWYSILVAPIFAVMFLNLSAVIRRRNKLPAKYFVAFLIHLLPLQVALIVSSMTDENLVLVCLGMCISALSMFAIILYDQIESYVRQQREIANQRASIMVLQMRPHFICNAMMSIYYLCAKDSKKAQQVTLDFTTYLRKNFTAIASEDTVPFPDELEHTRAYLAVEQVQFEDSLCVEYDTPHKNFRISIKTRETNFGSEIVVEDTGSGFALADDFEPHIALANIRQRLEMMCGGKMTIQPRADGGTVVTVTIP